MHSRQARDYLRCIALSSRLARESAGATLWIWLTAVAIQGTLPGLLVYVNKQLIDAIAAVLTGTSSSNGSRLYFWLGVEAACMLTGFVIARTIYSVLQPKVAAKIRIAASELIYRGLAAVNRESLITPELQNQRTVAIAYGVHGIADWWGTCARAVEQILSICSVGIALAVIDYHVLLIIVIAVVPYGICELYAARRWKRAEYDMAENARRSGYYSMVLTFDQFVSDLHLYDMYEFVIRKFREAEESMAECSLKAGRSNFGLTIWARAIALGGYYGAVILVITHGGLGLARIGSTIAYLQGAGRLQSAVEGLMARAKDIYESLLRQLSVQILMDQTDQKSTRKQACLRRAVESITLEDVWFQYPGSNHYVLKGVNLELRRGEMMALVGSNGAGKTTLASILAGLLTPTAGRVRYDGMDLSELDKRSVWRRMGFVLQDFPKYFFAVGEIIRSGPMDSLRPDELQGVIARCKLEGLLEGLPSGLDSQLGTQFKNGTDISAGQWQKLSIARALYRNPSVLIFDEPTASLDIEAEKEVVEIVNKSRRNCLMLMISHRLKTVQCADKIAYLCDGRIVDIGAHEELLAKEGEYWKWMSPLQETKA